MNLFYVVKVGSEWAIMEMTGMEMKQRLTDEPGLLGNLDRAPFKKRHQAEERRDWLNKQPKETNG